MARNRAFIGGSASWDSQGYVNTDRRSSFAYIAIGMSPAMVEKHVGTGSQYLWTPRDASGAFLEGLILAVVTALEVGDLARFATGEKLAAYAGTTPRIASTPAAARLTSVGSARTSAATSSGRSAKPPTRSV